MCIAQLIKNHENRGMMLSYYANYANIIGTSLYFSLGISQTFFLLHWDGKKRPSLSHPHTKKKRVWLHETTQASKSYIFKFCSGETNAHLAWVFNSRVVGDMNKDKTIMVYYTRNDMSIVCPPNSMSTPVIRQQLCQEKCLTMFAPIP